MTNDWKIRQEIYHKLNNNHDDDLNNVDIIECDNSQILDYALEYFKNDKLGWVYPAKSYVVAICYANWLSEDFGGDFYEYLDDPELLYQNDPYFIPYSLDKHTYDSIICNIDLKKSSGIVPDIRTYYEQEFMINEN